MNTRTDATPAAVLRPAHVSPMLPVRSTRDQCTSGYAYELCWDGVRVMAHVTSRATRLQSRRYRDITGSYPELADLHERVRRDVILDGEMIVAGDGGPDVQRLHRRRQERTEEGLMTEARQRDPVTFVVNDVVWLDTTPTWDRPYERRRVLLDGLLLDGLLLDHPSVMVGPSFADIGMARARAQDEGCSGVVAKRLGSPYRMGQRSTDWRVVGFVNREEFVVGGYVPGQGRRIGSIGALLVGRYPDRDSQKLRYMGSVGTGFSEADLEEFADLVERLGSSVSPFEDEVPRGDVRFCDAKLVVRVQYRDRTDSGLLRYPVYKGMMGDVDPATVIED
ncbi:MAG TPA: hypothetical protein VGA69_02040 [Nitriliruptorales bacterium]